MTTVQDRAQELLTLWDALRGSRSCIHVLDILEHKDNLQGLANSIRLNLYVPSANQNLDAACDKFEIEYIKVRDKIHIDLLETLQTK